MTKIDDEIYKYLKKVIPMNTPTKAEIAKFERKRELLDLLQDGNEIIKFRVEVSGFGDVKGGEPYGQLEFEQEDITELDRFKIRYTGKWYN